MNYLERKIVFINPFFHIKGVNVTNGICSTISIIAFIVFLVLVNEAFIKWSLPELKARALIVSAVWVIGPLIRFEAKKMLSQSFCGQTPTGRRHDFCIEAGSREAIAAKANEYIRDNELANVQETYSNV